jgi:Tfp pilus assembly ATPase PilU
MLSNGNDTFVNNRELFTDTKSWKANLEQTIHILYGIHGAWCKSETWMFTWLKIYNYFIIVIIENIILNKIKVINRELFIDTKSWKANLHRNTIFFLIWFLI